MKTLAVAGSAWKETVRQPIYYVILLVAAGMVFLSHFFAMFTFGQEAKFIYDMGLATITLAVLFQALFSASTVISEEIENKTALTVLSKPVNRWQFVLGKYLGVAGALLPAVAGLTVVLMLTTWWSKAYPYVQPEHEHYHTNVNEEEHEAEAHADEAHHEEEGASGPTLPSFVMLQGASFAKAGFMIYMQVAVLAAVSVAVSTRASMLLNLVICSVVFVVGHLSEYIRGVAGRAGSVVQALGDIFYAVVPNLEHFNIVGQKVSVGIHVSFLYILMAAAYGLGYIIVALLLALLLFRTREVG